MAKTAPAGGLRAPGALRHTRKQAATPAAATTPSATNAATGGDEASVASLGTHGADESP